jgi:MarR family transcriptional regulator, organic hydroperoxide resistance regulator
MILGLIACIGQEQKSEITRLLQPFEISLLQLQMLHALEFSPEGHLTVNQLKQTMIDVI